MKVFLRFLLFAAVCAALVLCLSACNKDDGSGGPTVYVYKVGEPFITNIKEQPKKLLKSEIVFRLTNKKAVETFAEDNDIIRDSVIKVLRELTEDECLNGDMNDIAQRLVDAANEAMQTDVFFSATFDSFTVN